MTTMRTQLISTAVLATAVLGFVPIAPSSCRHSRHRTTISHLHAQDALAASIDEPNPVASVKALDAIVPRSDILTLSRAKSNLRGAMQVLFHFSLVALAASIPFRPLSLLATAFVSSFYFNGMHETVHQTAFQSKLINDFFAHVFGFLCLRPARHYYYYHWQHHKYTGNVELDSELQPGLLDLPVDTPTGYVAYLSGIPFWMDAIITTVRHAMGICPEPYLLSDRAREEISTEARIYLCMYGLLALAATMRPPLSALLLRLWVLPAILGQPFLRFYLLAEHRGRKNSPLIYENTRTMDTNWLYRNLAWNMPYHMEHHAWPSVPFHRLGVAHRLLFEGMGESDLSEKGEVEPALVGSGSRGYIRFNMLFLRKLFRAGKQ